MADRRWGQKLTLILWVLLDTLKRFFTENKLLKLISLAIAVFMWFSTSTQEERSRTLENVHLKVINRRDDMIVTHVPLKVVDVRVRGPWSLITDLDPDTMAVTIDATGLAPGNHLIWLSQANVNTPPAVEVLRIDPPSIPLQVEPKLRRIVPVRPHLRMETLPPAQTLLESRVIPPTVELSGPASVVNRVQELETEPIDLSQVGSSATLSALLLMPAPNMAATPTEVQVVIHLDRWVEKRLTGLRLTPPARAIGQMTQTLSVTLAGPQSLLDKIRASDIIVKLDVAKLPKGEHEVSPAIELPEAYRAVIRITSVEPKTLMIRLR